MISLLNIIPYPYIINGTFCNGSIFKTLPACSRCQSKECQKAIFQQQGTCSYGFNFYKVNDHITLHCFLLKATKANSPARQKRIRESPAYVVSEESIKNIAEIIRTVFESIDKKILRIVEDEAQKRIANKSFTDSLRDFVSQGTDRKINAIFHDFRQYAGEVINNINVFAHNSNRHSSSEASIENLPLEILTAYHAAKLMTASLDSHAYTETPALLKSAQDISRFRVHSIALKIIRIYRTNFRERSLRDNFLGSNTTDIISNDKGVPIIIHTLINNACKYAPIGSDVTLDFTDHHNHVMLSISSLGPLIESDEYKKIFSQYYRGKNVDKNQHSGSGFGLFALATICNALEIAYEVNQKRTADSSYMSTTFTLRFPLKPSWIE